MYIVEEQKSKVFEFEAAGQKYAVPLLGSLPYPRLREMVELRKRGGADGTAVTAWIVEDVFPDFVGDVCERMTIKQVNKLVKAYVDESNEDDDLEK